MIVTPTGRREEYEIPQGNEGDSWRKDVGTGTHPLGVPQRGRSLSLCHTLTLRNTPRASLTKHKIHLADLFYSERKTSQCPRFQRRPSALDFREDRQVSVYLSTRCSHAKPQTQVDNFPS